jgi:hypothetical protein
LLIAEAIWLVVFRRSYTVHVRTNDHPPIKIHVRLPSEIAACHAAAQLVSRFQDDGPARAAKLAGRNYRQHPYRL